MFFFILLKKVDLSPSCDSEKSAKRKKDENDFFEKDLHYSMKSVIISKVSSVGLRNEVIPVGGVAEPCT